MPVDAQVIIQKYMKANADLQAKVFYLEAALAAVDTDPLAATLSAAPSSAPADG